MSTTSCLEFVTNKIMEVKRRNQVIAAIFIDLSNAFNAVKLHTLEQIMLSLNLSPEYASWCIAFLQDRTVQLQVRGEKLTRMVSQGLPQGDVLSPTLFNIYTAVLHEIRVEGVILVQYADDFSVLVEGKNVEEINNRSREFINKFYSRAKKLNLEMNLQKTKAMMFNNSLKPLEIIVNNIKIEAVNSYRYLGIYLDRSLKFGAHIRSLIESLTGQLNMIKVISSTKYGSHPQTLGLAYNAFFRSVMEYGCSVYGMAKKSNLTKIDVVNNQCLRKVTGCTRTTPKSTLQAIAAQHPPMFRRLKIAGKQVVKHFYFNSPVHEQIVQNTINHQKSYTLVESLAFQHMEILDNLSTMIVSDYQWDQVCVETDLIGNWKKKTTSTIVLKRVTLGLIHGKYKNRQIIYTDASSDGSICGIGIFHEPKNTRISLKLKNNVCIMSAEIEAIYVALQYITRNQMEHAVIMTDSKSGCAFIKNFIGKRERDSVIDAILKMASNSKTTIQWIPGHSQISGNETADTLAKAALHNQFTCNNKILLHDAINHVCDHSDEIAQQWYVNYVSELGKGRKYFRIQNTIPHKPWYHNLTLNNKETRTINRLLSGHDFSRYWLFKIKITDDCLCQTCNRVENAEHILFACKQYEDTRKKYNLEKFNSIYELYETQNIDLLKNAVSYLEAIKQYI